MTTSTYAERLEAKKKIRQAAIEIAMLNQGEMEYFLDNFFEQFPKEKKPDFFDKLLDYQLKDNGKWDAIDAYIEGCFTKNPHFTPKVVAHMCCWYRKIPFKAKPALMRRARKIKNKLFKRRQYAIVKDLNDSV